MLSGFLPMKNLFLVLLAVATLLGACRSADRLTQICEDNYSKCNLACTSTNARFTTSKTAQQNTSRCDLECDTTYQTCLKHQDQKTIKGVSDY